MKDLLPQRLIPIVLEQAGIDGRCQVNQISREQRQDLVDSLQALTLTITGDAAYRGSHRYGRRSQRAGNQSQDDGIQADAGTVFCRRGNGHRRLYGRI